MRVAAVLVVLLGCGWKTGLEVGDAPAPGFDAGVDSGPCTPLEPEVLFDQPMSLQAVAGDKLWVTAIGFELNWISLRTGDVTTVDEGFFGLRSFVVGDDRAWWAHSGRSDFAGEVVRVDRRDRTERLDDGLFQPGGVQYDGENIYYAEWTNSGSLRDEMRGRIFRMNASGGRRTTLAEGLGLPTDTALTGGYVYWVDRRRDHVARVPVDGGDIEIVADVLSVRSALTADEGAVYFADLRTLFRLDTETLDVQVMAELPTDSRGLVAHPQGVLIQLWYGSGRVGNALGFVPFGGEFVELDASGSNPIVGNGRIYWNRNSDLDTVVVHVCDEWLARF